MWNIFYKFSLFLVSYTYTFAWIVFVNIHAQRWHKQPKDVTDITNKLAQMNHSPLGWKWKKVTWHTAKYGDPYSEFVLCIYPYTHTHTHTPGAVGSHLYCSAQGTVGGCSKAPQSWYWRWRALDIHCPPYNPCRTIISLVCKSDKLYVCFC